jgi:type IV secretory pathway TrbF-like protein
MFERSPEGDGCAPEHATPLQQDDVVWDECGGSTSARAVRRRLTAVGLWLISASLVSGLLCQVMWLVDANRPVQPKDTVSEDIDDLPDQPRASVHLTHVIADVWGLGIAVQRRRCRDCRHVQCLCVVWRVAREGRHA